MKKETALNRRKTLSAEASYTDSSEKEYPVVMTFSLLPCFQSVLLPTSIAFLFSTPSPRRQSVLDRLALFIYL